MDLPERKAGLGIRGEAQGITGVILGVTTEATNASATPRWSKALLTPLPSPFSSLFHTWRKLLPGATIVQEHREPAVKSKGHRRQDKAPKPGVPQVA